MLSPPRKHLRMSRCLTPCRFVVVSYKRLDAPSTNQSNSKVIGCSTLQPFVQLGDHFLEDDREPGQN